MGYPASHYMLFAAYALTACIPPYQSVRAAPAFTPVVRPMVPDWSSDDIYQIPQFIDYRTSPSTWAQGGGFGLQWGMGPSNVRDQLPALEAVFADIHADDPTQYEYGSFDHEVEGHRITIFVRFRRGSLFLVELSYLEMGGPIDPDGFQARRSDWGAKALQILLTKYGEPKRSPSATALDCIIKNKKWQESCITEDYEYWWVSGGTDIRFNTFNSKLSYADLRELDAYKADARRKKQGYENARRKERERF